MQMKHRLFKRAKEIALEHSVTAILAALGTLLALIGRALLELLPADFLAKVPTRVWLPLLGLSLLISVASIIALFVNTRGPKFQTLYGIKWAKDYSAHCPACSLPLVGFTNYSGYGLAYKCVKCDKFVPLRNTSGEHIWPDDVRKILESMGK